MIMIMDENTHDWRTGRHVVYELHAHIVFVTKYRRKVMTPRVAKLLEETFGEVCERFECELEEFETDKDHAHLLVAYPPKTQLSTLVMSLKTNSSKRVRNKTGPKSDKRYGEIISGRQATASSAAAEHLWKS